MIKESFLLAWRSVSNNKLRSGITIAIIALGIMALIGIITAIQAMEQKLTESFAMMGANSFQIRYKELDIRIGEDNSSIEKSKKGQKLKKANLDKIINKEMAETFKANYKFPLAKVSIWRRGPDNQEIHYKDLKTNPQIRVLGGDENYLLINAYEIEYGRNINENEIQSASFVCLLGYNVAKKLFGDKLNNGINQFIKVGSISYKVIGILKEKGTSAFLKSDDMVLTSHTNIRYLSGLSTRNTGIGISYLIGISVNHIKDLDPAIYEATSLFRNIRKLTPIDKDNFSIEKSDKIANSLISFLSLFGLAAIIIGMVTLTGAAIALMNIMLVAVNERSREIGLIKSIGAKNNFIRNQFLFESIIISVLGAIIGIIAGIIVGNLIGIFLNTGFLIPWKWTFIGITICTLVGLFAGLYPAIKASKLNPIEVLRVS